MASMSTRFSDNLHTHVEAELTAELDKEKGYRHVSDQQVICIYKHVNRYI